MALDWSGMSMNDDPKIIVSKRVFGISVSRS